MESLIIIFWLAAFGLFGAAVSYTFMKIFKKEILQFIPTITIGLIVSYFSFLLIFEKGDGWLDLARFISILLFGSAFIGSITTSIIYKRKQGK